MANLAGPNKTQSESIELYVAYQSGQGSSGSQGPASGSYSGEEATKGKLETALSNYGPKFGPYIPELIALIGNEI